MYPLQLQKGTVIHSTVQYMDSACICVYELARTILPQDGLSVSILSKQAVICSHTKRTNAIRKHL